MRDRRCVTECVIGRYCEHVREYAAESRHDPKAVAIFQRVLGRRRSLDVDVALDNDSRDDDDNDDGADNEAQRKRASSAIVLDDKLGAEARAAELARQCADCLPPAGQFGFVGRPQWCRW